MARKHVFGIIRRFDRGQKSPERRRPAGRGMFRSLRIEAVEARALLSAAGVDADGQINIATEEPQPAAIVFQASGDPVVVRAAGNSGAQVFDSSNGDFSIDETDQPALKMETPGFARIVPEQGRGVSLAQDSGGLVDITVAMGASQRPGSNEANGLRGGFRRDIDRALTHGAGQDERRTLVVDGQYAMVQAFELSGGDLDSVEADDAAADRQAPARRRDDPPPQPTARPGEGDVTRATRANHRQQNVPSDSPAEASDDSTHDDQRISLSPAPVDRGPRAAVFEQLGENQTSGVFGPAAYLSLGRKSGIAPAMIVAVGGQLLLGASWRSRRRLSPEPAVERPLRQ